MHILDVFPNVSIPLEEEVFFNTVIEHTCLSRGEHFVSANTLCQKIGFVDSGRLQSFIEVNDTQITLATHHDKQIVTVFSSLLLEIPANVTIQAIEPTCMTVISQTTFYTLLKRHSCWIDFWLRAFQSQIQHYELIEKKFHVNATMNQKD